ncbi:hypothetical protein QBC41DRAFT_267366 [Cercophora samala]|uniref:Uncharacterized protein n=1 Tax=Cercophora samala TaxID=330535 RepID=A0AA40DF82_9PEZI|nr:hypothetical protein QBC41DRAFT_267366 [Cercophora samala]
MGHQPAGSGGAEKGKGKDRETRHDQDETLHNGGLQSQDTASALGRIVQSAVSLPSYLMAGTPEFGSGGSEKGEGSRVGQSLARAGDSSVQVRANPSAGGTLRPGHAEAHVAREEASFAAFLDSDEVPMLSEPAGLEESWQATTAPPAWEPSQSVKEQMVKDGADVVALLSGHTDPEPDLLPGESASPAELASLRKALFGKEDADRSTTVAWDSVLNFIPEYLRANTTAGGNTELYSHLGADNPDEAWQSWLDQWSRVLTDYQDEVWGDLNALVDDARDEIKRMEQVQPGEMPPEPKALLRLRAILGHLRGT